MVEALELPEILVGIGKFLGKKDIRSSVLVNKRWRDVLEPLLWRSFVLTPMPVAELNNILESAVALDQYSDNNNNNNHDNDDTLTPNTTTTTDTPITHRTFVPTLPVMVKNAHHIRSLTIELDMPEAFRPFYQKCKQLQDLTVRIQTPFVDKKIENRIWSTLADMVENHPRLRRLFLSAIFMSPSVEFLKALGTCSSLVVFESSDVTFKGEAVEYYFQLCRKLKRLSSRCDGFILGDDSWGATEDDTAASALTTAPTTSTSTSTPRTIESMLADLEFPEMLYLDIRDAVGIRVESQFEWISKCPALVGNVWESGAKIPVERFCEQIPTACPRLTALHLLVPIEDQEIALILDSVRVVEKLTLTRTGFGRRAMASLERHFPTLKDINLQFCPGATSDMIQMILRSCPNLQSVSADSLLLQDLGDPWVCNQLQLFDICIGGIYGETQSTLKDEGYRIVKDARTRIVFEYLSKLKHLQYLSIASAELSTFGFGVDQMHIRMSAGLDLLKDLKDIKFFSCKALMSHNSEAEALEAVEWMVTHWKKLETIEAVLPEALRDEGTSKAIKVMKDHEVVFVDYLDVLREYQMEDDFEVGDEDFAFTDYDDEEDDDFFEDDYGDYEAFEDMDDLHDALDDSQDDSADELTMGDLHYVLSGGEYAFAGEEDEETLEARGADEAESIEDRASEYADEDELEEPRAG